MLLPPRRRRPVLVALLIGACGVALIAWSSSSSSSSSSSPAAAGMLPATSSSFSLSRRSPSAEAAPPGMRDWLEGCRYLYIDVGTNVGLQIRKLFEPDLYRRALVLPTFDEAFGADRLARHPQELCAVGFEPNPAHAPALRELMTHYKALGWRVHVFTGVAASTIDGEAKFYLDGEAPEQYRQPGSSLLPWAPTHETLTVETIDLARYLLEEVGRREYDRSGGGEGRPPPAVLMKVDVESFEHQLLPHLIVTGGLCRTPVNLMMMESHLGGEWRSSGGVDSMGFVHFFDEFVAGQRRNGTASADSCPVTIVEMDDEVYDTRSFPLPTPEGEAPGEEGR